MLPCRERDESAIYELDPSGEAYGNIYELRKVQQQPPRRQCHVLSIAFVSLVAKLFVRGLLVCWPSVAPRTPPFVLPSTKGMYVCACAFLCGSSSGHWDRDVENAANLSPPALSLSRSLLQAKVRDFENVKTWAPYYEKILYEDILVGSGLRDWLKSLETL